MPPEGRGAGAVDRLALWDLVEWRAARSGDAVMAVDEHGAQLTFGRYRDRCLQVAAAFAAAGAGRDVAVAWMLPTSLNALVLAGALSRLGAVQVPLLPALREKEVAYILRQTGAAHLVVPGRWRGFDYPGLAAAVTRGLGHVTVTVADGSLPEGDAPAQAALAELAPWAGVRPPEDQDPRRWIFFTSGTTAHPKGTLHTDRTVAAAAVRLNRRFQMTAADTNALVFPVTHIGGISWLMGGLMAGYRHVLVEAFDPVGSCEVLRKHHVTIAGSGPAFWMAYVAAQRRQPDVPVFPELRALVGGGAAKSPTLNAEVRDVLGVPLVTGYGSSECPGVAHSGVGDPDDVLAADGYALDDSEIAVVGPDGVVERSGGPGEIVVRGPMLFHGYLDASDNDGAFDADGWFHTGDVGTVDERGVLRVTGRLKDIVIRKGENISAKEVEDVLHLHPAVADVAVIALPDAERGELCCAVVVLEGPDRRLTLDDLRHHCRARRLARYKVPERLEVVTTIPRNATGKALKAELVTRYSASRPGSPAPDAGG